MSEPGSLINTVSQFIPSREERGFGLKLIETDHGVSLYEIDKTIRFDITYIGRLLIERLLREGLISNATIYSPTAKIYFLIGRGSKTNFNSIPSIIRWVISPTHPALTIPSFIHDWAVSEFESSEFALNFYNGNYYIYRTSYESGFNSEKSAIYDLQMYIGQFQEKTPLGKIIIKWSEAAEIYYKAASVYKGKNNRIAIKLAYNGVRLYGFFKRILGNTK
jgi:hypothetical protein